MGTVAWNSILNLGVESQQELRIKEDLVRRQHILELQFTMEKFLEENNIPNAVPEAQHHFAPGVYAREMLIPAGMLIIGKIHKHAHLNIISKGLAWLYTEEGRTLIQDPYTFTSLIGVKRVVLAIQDTLWTTIHLTDKTDLDEIEEEVLVKNYSELAQAPPEETL